MFERYTEGARRAIFFARYEASLNGSPWIETGHLLLGILREGAPLFRELGINALEPIAEECRKALGSPGPKVSTSVDLPLSNPSKRVLAYAAEEAARLQSRVIGPQHLALGLLREGDAAAEILKRHGITVEKIRGVRAEGTPDRVPAVGFTSVPLEFVCDNKPVGRADATIAMPWPRVGESIVLSQEDSRQIYTVVDVGHFYAVPKDQPENEPSRLVKIVVTLQHSKHG